MIDFTLAELLTGLDMSDPESDHDFRPRVVNAMLAHHEANQSAAYGGATVEDLKIFIATAADAHLDDIGKHYGISRSSAPDEEETKKHER